MHILKLNLRKSRQFKSLLKHGHLTGVRDAGTLSLKSSLSREKQDVWSPK